MPLEDDRETGFADGDGNVHALPLFLFYFILLLVWVFTEERMKMTPYAAWRGVAVCPALDLDGLMTGPRPGRAASVDEAGELCQLRDFFIAIGASPDSWDGVAA